MERFAGRYALLRLLGRGGMGTVHLALDLSAETECALKQLHPSVIDVAPDLLRREFQLLGRVRHPAVVEVRELGVAPDGTLYYTMEYVPGLPADRALRPGDWRALCFVAAQIAGALEALHAGGVLHGDLKPSNVLVLPAAEPGGLPSGIRVLDFGLAALLGDAREGHRGTPGYVAPEIVRGDLPTIAGDLYGLGATLYALAAGQVAFSTTGTSSVLRRQQSGPPPALPLEEAGVPGPLVRLILRLMAPDPGERPRDAREARAELERIEPAARRSLSECLRTEWVLGRERELARLDRWLLRGPGGPNVMVVSGDPGVGKSQLLGELAVRATLASRAVFRLACAAFDAPGSLAVTLCRRMAAEAPGEGRESDAGRPALERLADPAFSARVEDSGVLADAIVAWARAIHQRGAAPLVVLDDADRLDALSRLVVTRAAYHRDGGVLRWVWSERASTDPESPATIATEHVDWLALGPLDEPAIHRLAAARLHRESPQELSAFLWKRSGGHPGLAVELLRTAAETGALSETEVGITIDPEALERVALSPDFEETLLRRLATLPQEARSAAAALAVWNRPATPDEVRTLDPEAGAGALDILSRARLAESDESGRWRLRAPGLARQLAAARGDGRMAERHRTALAQPRLSDAERYRHLRGAGEARAALEAAATAMDAGADISVAIEAAGLADAEVPDEAGAWHERAGRALLERGRHRAAIDHLERAVQLAAAGEARGERMLMLSTAYLRAGRQADVQRIVERALAENPSGRVRSMLTCNEAGRQLSIGERERSLATAQAAMALGTHAGADEATGLAALAAGGALMALGRYAEAEAAAEEAIACLERAGHRSGVLRAASVRAAAAAATQDLPRSERIYRKAIASARTDGLRHATEELLTNLAVAVAECGRWSEALEAHAEVLRTALEDGRARSVAVATTNLAILDGLTGNSGQALRRSRTAIRLCRAHLPGTERVAWRALAQAERISGRPRRAARAARRALALAARTGPSQELDWCRIEYARARAQLGHWGEAGDVAERALARQRPGDTIATLILATIAARAAIRRRDVPAAEKWLAFCDARLPGRTAPYADAQALQVRAELAFVEGQPAEGSALAQRALDAFAALQATPDRSVAALDFARMAMTAEAGHDAPVTEWLHEAAGAFERMGDHPNRERALALTVEWLERSRVPAPSASHDRDLLKSVSLLLDSLSDLQTLTRRAMQLAVEHLGAERGVLLLTDERTGEIVPVVEHGAIDADARGRALSYSRRAVERVARSGGSLLITDAPTDPEMLSESVVGLGLRSIVCVPMYVGGKVLGAAYLDDSRRSDTFSVEDRGLLEGFAHLMAIAIEKSRGHAEVQRANEQLVGENLSLRREVSVRFQPQNFVGVSSAMQKVLAMVERAAQTSTTVLITGENGTGKELIARILHHSGKRQDGPFVAVNCGAIPESLLESELFGILPSVATGVRGRDGRFVQAEGGTLFLDEIGDMPLKQQVALLSALANREVTPVGGGKAIPVDVRIIAASNRDMRRRVDEGAFREDLYYRLNVIPIEVPPLRERKADIPAMAHHFAALFAQQQERPVPELSPDLVAALMRSDWPGNVRELQNYVERVMAMTPGRVLHPHPLPPDVKVRRPRLHIEPGRQLVDVVDEVERRMIREALERCGGNQSRAARELGMTEQSMRYRLRKYALPGARRNQRDRRNQR